MKTTLAIFGFIASFLLFGACTDDENFSTSTSSLLTFSTDTVAMDTVFSRVPSSTYSFWVYNRTDKGLRCSTIRLSSGNQVGFRVNVDGEYLSPTAGYQVSDVEVRKGDSIRVFVELTSAETGQLAPKKIDDNLIFTLESGVEQKVNLNAYSWDATFLKDKVITGDTLISSEKPVVVYGTLKVDSTATLRIAAGTTLYFHANAGIDVYGRIVSEGTAANNVILRGDRTDRMFDYLPYDNVSGQWHGLRLRSSSFDNIMTYTDLHGAMDGILCDSASVERTKLSLSHSTVHNCQGYGLLSINCKVDVENCQITNTLNNCIAVLGGDILLKHCTLAQFYPFDANRGAALMYANYNGDYNLPLLRLECINTVVTGYSDNQVDGSRKKDSEAAFNYHFVNSLLRTTTPSEKDSIPEGSIENVIWEDVESMDKNKPDTITGEHNFKLIDIDKQRYDFHLVPKSAAVDTGNAEQSLPDDRDGNTRDDKPDIGCYEFIENNEGAN